MHLDLTIKNGVTGYTGMWGRNMMWQVLTCHVYTKEYPETHFIVIMSWGKKKMNLSFAGCGFLGLYHLGVVSCVKTYAPNVFTSKVFCGKNHEYQFVFSWIMFEVSGASAGSIAAVAILIDDIDIGDIIAEVGMNYDSELQELLPVISSICVSRPEEGHLAHFPPHLISTNICLTVCSTISRNMFTKL